MDIVVSGPGPIGTMCALLLSQRGHRVILRPAQNEIEKAVLPRQPGWGWRRWYPATTPT